MHGSHPSDVVSEREPSGLEECRFLITSRDIGFHLTNYRGNFESLRCHNLPSKIAVLSILTQFRLISSLRSVGGVPSNIDTDTAHQLSLPLPYLTREYSQCEIHTSDRSPGNMTTADPLYNIKYRSGPQTHLVHLENLRKGYKKTFEII